MPNFTNRHYRFHTIISRLSLSPILYHNRFTSFWRYSYHLVAANAGFLIVEPLPNGCQNSACVSYVCHARAVNWSSTWCSHLSSRKHEARRKIEFVRTQTVYIRKDLNLFCKNVMVYFGRTICLLTIILSP